MRPRPSPHLWPALAGGVAGAVYLLYGILASTNSTSVVGLLFLPFYAALGAAVAASCAQLWFVCRRRRPLSSFPTLAAVVLLGLLGTNLWQREVDKRLLAEARTTLSPERIDAIISTPDANVVSAVALNPALEARQIERILSQWPRSYQVLGALVTHPKLARGHLELLARPGAFAPNQATEARLYETYVIAPLLRRADIAPELFHELAGRPEQETFVIYAIIASTHATCEEIRPHLSSANEVLASAVARELANRSCP